MTVLLGPNGAGKTTLIRVLAGILPATHGDVALGSRRLRDLGRSAIARQCAYLPQQTGTAFALRVEDVVMLGRYPHVGTWGGLARTDYDRVTWALDRVGLSALRRRTLPTLSGGERQRVFLARRCQEAPILLLDEPIAALDIGRQLGVDGLAEGAQSRRTHHPGRLARPPSGPGVLPPGDPPEQRPADRRRPDRGRRARRGPRGGLRRAGSAAARDSVSVPSTRARKGGIERFDSSPSCDARTS